MCVIRGVKMSVKKMMCLLALIYCPITWSLDTDLYKESIVESEPKILILLDTSGSMRCSGDPSKPEFNGKECASMMRHGGKVINTGSSIIDTGVFTNAQPEARMKSVKDILMDFINPDSPDAWPDSFHVGLSTFSYPGSAVIRPVQALGDEATDESGTATIIDGGLPRPLTARDILKREIYAVTSNGITPTLGAIFEAAMYMSSQPVVTAASRTYAADNSFHSILNFPRGSSGNWTRLQSHRISHPDSFTGGIITPRRIDGRNKSDCQKAMDLYGPEFGRFTDACAKEVITAQGDLRYKGPNDNALACTGDEKHIILITDGFPINSSGSNQVRDGLKMSTWMRRYLTENMNAVGADPRCTDNAKGSNGDAWRCMQAISKKLKDRYNTTTHVISFLADRSTKNNLSRNNLQLKSLAESSGGGFYLAQKPAEIKEAIQEIAVAATNSASFASPTIAVDNFNPFAHQNMVSYSLFRPSSSKFWYGNLKRYKLGEINGKSQVLDQNNKAAINLTTGQFNDGISSFWSNVNDGSNILLGGAASNLRTGNHVSIFTDFGQGKSNCNTPLRRNSPLRKVAGCEKGIKEYLYTRAMIGRTPGNTKHITQAQEDTTHWFKWLTGIDHKGREWEFMKNSIPVEDLPPTPAQINTTDRLRPWMGAALHSSPFVVNYKTISSTLSNSHNINAITERVFISTNDGALYAFTAWDGKEVFRFYPEPLLDKIKDFSAYGQGDLSFGLDGQWTLWREDKANNKGIKDGIISAADGDKVALFGGMRRGGDFYYALDITDLDNPKIIFKAHGSADGKTPSSPALARLGQTWSKPELINVKINDKPEVLMAVGGGYDTRYDPPSNGTNPIYHPGASGSMLGNAIYLIYAEGDKAGEVAAWVSSDARGAGSKQHNDMRYSIPARLAVLDLNLDGFADHIYAADLAGQVFRLDLDNKNTSADQLISDATTLGKFGVTGQTREHNKANRRFHEGPSIALIEDSLISKHYIAVALASGWRENPFETDGKNYFYLIRDTEPLDLYAGLTIKNSPYPITHRDLGNKMIDVDKITESDIDKTKITENSKLYKTVVLTKALEVSGEKSFGLPLIASNKVYFSTLIPADLDDPSIIDGATCTKDTGDSRVYAIDLFNGEGALPSLKNHKPGTSKTVEYYEYESALNAGDITTYINKEGEPTISSGQTPITQLPIPDNITKKMHWRKMKSGSEVDRDQYYR